MTTTIRGPAKSVRARRRPVTKVVAASTPGEFILMIYLGGEAVIRFETDDAKIVDHIAAVAKLAQGRLKRGDRHG